MPSRQRRTAALRNSECRYRPPGDAVAWPGAASIAPKATPRRNSDIMKVMARTGVLRCPGRLDASASLGPAEATAGVTRRETGRRPCHRGGTHVGRARPRLLCRSQGDCSFAAIRRLRDGANDTLRPGAADEYEGRPHITPRKQVAISARHIPISIPMRPFSTRRADHAALRFCFIRRGQVRRRHDLAGAPGHNNLPRCFFNMLQKRSGYEVLWRLIEQKAERNDEGPCDGGGLPGCRRRLQHARTTDGAETRAGGRYDHLRSKLSRLCRPVQLGADGQETRRGLGAEWRGLSSIRR